MRNTVDFVIPGVRWPEETDDDSFSDILLAKHAAWFLEIVRRIEWLTVDSALCQEDWGVVVFAHHDKLKFWIGLSYGGGEPNSWLAHVHHGSFAIVQRFTAKGRKARRQLVLDLDRALRGAGATALRWYDERDINHREAAPSPE